MSISKPEQFTVEMIQAISRKLGEAVEAINSGATAMQLHQIESLEVLSAGQMRDSLRFAKNFSRALHDAIEQKELEKAGLYQSKPAESEKPKRKKKGE